MEVKLRIKNEFKKTGYFWLPSAPERKIPGTLVITDGGRIELEVVGLFDESIGGLDRAINNKNELKRKDELKRIVGNIEKHGFVTLDDCFYTNQTFSFGGVSKSSIYVNKVFIGAAYDENEVALFNSFKFSVEGIDEWVGLSGIKIEYNEEQTISITCTPQKEISLNLDGGMKLLIKCSSTLVRTLNPKEVKIVEKTYFKLISEQELPLNNFISVAYKITTLLCFAIDKTVSIEKVSVTSKSVCQDIGGEKTVPVSILLYYASLPHTKNDPQIDCYGMLFRFEQVKEDAERIVNNWLDAYDKIGPALNLYFYTKMGMQKNLEGRFLSLAQALETYHRRTSDETLRDKAKFKKLVNDIIEKCPSEEEKWLRGRLEHGNELSLSSRIKRIIEPFKKILGNNKNRKKLTRKIVDTRNYLTHYDQSLEPKIATGEDLLWLCFKMEAIFQLHLLQVLGFTQSKVESISENSVALRRKLKHRSGDNS